MALELRGMPVARATVASLEPRVEELKSRGVTPTLAIVRVGAREDDLAYERGAKKRCLEAGIAVRIFELDAECSQQELEDVVARVNEDTGIHGCLMFRPLPANLDETAVCEALDPAKDVDGITRQSMVGVFANQQVGFPPCTAQAVIDLLDYYDVELEGADVCVLGRSLVIGKPVSLMLQARNATVTMCHTRTRDLADKCRAAQVLVVAAGHPKTIGAQETDAGQVVVDVGINWDERAQRLCGDVSYDEVAQKVSGITPVPGGVGSVTTSVLAKHVVLAAERAARGCGRS